MNNVQKANALSIAAMLDQDDELWEFVADAISASRDKAQRIAGDRDSGEVLEDVIAALRAAS